MTDLAAMLGIAAPARDRSDPPAAWEPLCQVLLCANEFLYLE
jgi:hypothetical protein